MKPGRKVSRKSSIEMPDASDTVSFGDSEPRGFSQNQGVEQGMRNKQAPRKGYASTHS